MIGYRSPYRAGWRRVVARLAAALLLVANTVSVLAANDGAWNAPAGAMLVPVCTADGLVLRPLTLSPDHQSERPFQRPFQRLPVHRFPACALCVVAGQSLADLPAPQSAPSHDARACRNNLLPVLTQPLPQRRPFGQPGRPRDPPALHRPHRPASASARERQMEIQT